MSNERKPDIVGIFLQGSKLPCRKTKNVTNDVSPGKSTVVSHAMFVLTSRRIRHMTDLRSTPTELSAYQLPTREAALHSDTKMLLSSIRFPPCKRFIEMGRRPHPICNISSEHSSPAKGASTETCKNLITRAVDTRPSLPLL